MLRGWNFDAKGSSAAETIFEAWFHQLAPVLVGDELPPLTLENYKTRFTFITRFVLATLASRDGGSCDNVTTDRRETCDDAVSAALRAAVTDLTTRLGTDLTRWRWDAVHHAVFPHQGLDTVKALRPLLSRSAASARSPGPPCRAVRPRGRRAPAARMSSHRRDRPTSGCRRWRRHPARDRVGLVRAMQQHRRGEAARALRRAPRAGDRAARRRPTSECRADACAPARRGRCCSWREKPAMSECLEHVGAVHVVLAVRDRQAEFVQARGAARASRASSCVEVPVLRRPGRTGATPCLRRARACAVVDAVALHQRGDRGIARIVGAAAAEHVVQHAFAHRRLADRHALAGPARRRRLRAPARRRR